jgi:hypothetical protein
MTEKIKLSGGLDKTVTWVWIDNCHLKVEFYDFSETAQEMSGNDIAYVLTVEEMDKLFALVKRDENSLAPWVAENFMDYFGIERWLKDNGISFRVDRESWA